MIRTFTFSFPFFFKTLNGNFFGLSVTLTRPVLFTRTFLRATVIVLVSAVDAPGGHARAGAVTLPSAWTRIVPPPGRSNE